MSTASKRRGIILAGHPTALVLGDNLFHGHDLVPQLLNSNAQAQGAKIFAYPISDRERYGVAEFDADARVLSLEENLKSLRAVTPSPGCIFTTRAFAGNSSIRSGAESCVSGRDIVEGSCVFILAFKRDDKMKVLVLGGTGFLGRHLCQSLAESNEVTVVSRRKPDLTIDLAKKSSIKYIQGDIASFDFVNESCNGVDCLINLASTVVPSTSNRDPVYDVNTNLIGALNTLRASVAHGISKYVFLSSGGTVYGSKNLCNPCSEIDQTDPICSYGIVKLSIEKYIHMYSTIYGLPYAIIRLSNPYGPQFSVEKPQGVVHHFISKIIKNEEISIWGDGSVERDFIYIDDTISALNKAIYHQSSQCLLNIGSGTLTSLKTLIDILEEISCQTCNVIYEPSRSYDLQKSVLNIDKAKIQLGWEPTVSISDGIRLTYLDALKSL